MNAFFGQTTIASGGTPTPLVGSSQQVFTQLYLTAITTGTVVVYVGFYPSQAAATASMTTSNSYTILAGQTTMIPVGALKQFQGDSYGNLQYVFLLGSTGTPVVSYFGV